MNSSNARTVFLLVPFGFAVYLLDRFFMPHLGMLATQMISGLILLAVLAASQLMRQKEGDEREQVLQLQADSLSLHLVLGGLLAAAIFYPHSQFAMAFWMVLGLVALGRIASYLYQRYS